MVNMITKMKLTKRTGDIPDGYYYYTDNKSHKYSVVDFGTTMKTHPMPEGIFMGWEAMKIDDDGGLAGDVIRAISWEELEKLIK